MAIGRPEPTQEQRRAVKKLAGFGLTQQQICSVVGIRSPKVLRQQFRQELAMGPVEARTAVMRTAFRLANSGRNPAMTMFWLKTRGRWSETKGLPQEREHLSEPARFIIEEYQPPRSPEEEAELQALIEQTRRLGSMQPEWDGDRVCREDAE